MNFTCDNCSRRYTVPDEKVRGRTVKAKCKNCQHTIILRGDSLGGGEATKLPTSAMVTAAPPSIPGDWYVMIKGQQVGPVPAHELSARVLAGEVNPRSFFWKKGMPDWKRGAELPELTALLAGEPVAAPAQAPAPAPAARRAPAASRPEPVAAEEPAAEQKAELFSDANRDAEPAPEKPAKKKKPEPEPDPFAALGDIDPSKLPPPGEATQFFIAQAGVNKRNPPWKIALFVGAWVAVPAGLVYLLSSLNVVPLQVVRIDEQGHQVTESVFSQGIVSGIGDLLSGKTIKAKKEAEQAQGGRGKRPAAVAAQGEPPTGATQPTTDTPPPQGVDLAAFYGEKADKGPVARKDVELKQKDGQAGGPEQEAVAKIVAASQPAFQFCVEQELRKNPKFRGGKILITATIGTSGAVKTASIDRREIESSELGECLKGKAKRMMFGTFTGEDVQVEFPLILTSSM